jgi:outer membrane protein TolC
LREFRFRQEGIRARQQSAEAELRATRARIAAAVRYAYRCAVLAEERVNLARRALDLRRGIRSTVFRQVSAGLKEADERDLADLTVDEAESELRRAAMLAEADRRKLARLVDPSGSMRFSLAVDPALLAVAALPERAVLVDRAVQSRAELDAMGGACREYAAAGKLAGDQRYPWFSFVEVTHRITAIPDRGAWGFKFGVDLPLFRSRASAEARVAAARRARCEMQKQALRSQIRNEVEESAGTLEELQRELAELDRLRSGPGERALERTRTALALGRAEKVDVLNAEVRVLGLRDRWLERRMQYAEIEAKLETALGVPLAGI